MAQKKILSHQEKVVAASAKALTKSANFEKLATARMTRLLKQIDSVGKLSNRSSYVYTAEQISAMGDAVGSACKAAFARFSATAGASDSGFSFKK